MAACKDCVKPAVFWEGEQAGKETVLNGLPAYISQPASSTGKAVLIVQDIYGWEAHNTRLLADKFAAAGFTSVVADLYSSDPPPLDGIPKGDWGPFLEWQKRLTPDIIIPKLDKVLEALKADYGITSVGTIGYCWGARFAVILANSDKVKAAAFNHGSFVDDEILKGVKQPLQINASDNDQQISPARLDEIKAILAAKPDVSSDVKFYPNTFHGWSIRGDAKDPAIGPAIVDVFERNKSWFQKHL